MVLKPEQERVKTLLVDTITLLCRNGLTFKTEFNINALIGITLDKEDIFLVDIRETIKNAAAAAEQEAAAAETASSRSSPGSRQKRTESTNSKSRKRRKHSSRGDGVDASESEAETEASSAAANTNSEKTKSSTTDSSNKEPPSKRMIKQEMFEQLTSQNEEPEQQQPLIVKPEPGYRQRPCDNGQQQAFNSGMDSIAGPSSWDPGQQHNFNPNTSLANSQQHPQVYFPFGDLSPQQKARKKSYAHCYKLEVVAYAETHSKEETARHFGVDSKTVRDWCKAKARLQAASPTRKRLAGGGRKSQLVELEEALMLWVADQWSMRVKLNCKMIQEKAKELFHSGTVPCPETFAASSGWLQKFLNRQGIRLGRDLRPPSFSGSGELMLIPPEQYCFDGDHNSREVELVSFYDTPQPETKSEETEQESEQDSQQDSQQDRHFETRSEIQSQQESQSEIQSQQESQSEIQSQPVPASESHMETESQSESEKLTSDRQLQN